MKQALCLLLLTCSMTGLGLGSLGAGTASDLAAQEIRVQPYVPRDQVPQSPDAERAFDSISRAWSGRDAGSVAELIPADGRANVTIEGRGVSSQMSRGQFEAVLSGLFSETERAAFDLSKPRSTSPTSAYAVGDWVYQAGEPGQRQREKVFIVLRQSASGGWSLSEVRIQPVR
jgi:hypothetical protein